jgi:alcohol dehydrogenase class IV
MNHDNAFEMAVSAVRFGAGVTREVGFELAELGARHVLVVTDPGRGAAARRCRSRVARRQPHPAHGLRWRPRRAH